MRFFLLLSAACACGNSAATMKRVDLLIRLKNSSVYTFEICSPWMTACLRVLPGALMVDGMVTDGQEKVFADDWVEHHIVKGCGHLIHVKNIVEKRADERARSNLMTMNLVVSQTSMNSACRAAEEARPPGKLDAVIQIP